MLKQQRAIQNNDTRDPLYSGRYLIKKLRHRFHEGAYKCIMDCVKDSVFDELPFTGKEKFPPESNAEEPQGVILSTDEGYQGGR